MSEKLVHVNAYTKRDGTEVKEHYRGRGIVASTNPINDDAFESDGGVAGGNPPDPFNTKILDWFGLGDLIKVPYSIPFQQNLVLEGGVSKDVQYPGDTGEVFGEVGEAIQVISTLMAGGQFALRGIQLASSIKQAIENFGEGSVEYMQPELDKTFNLLRSSYTKSKELESATLDKLSETNDQREYERLYKSYVDQREYNKKINHTLNRVEYSLQQKDYDGVVKELQNYQTIQDDSLKNLTQDWSLNQIQPTIPDATDYPMPQPLTPPQDWDYVLRNIGKESPEAQKLAIGFVMNVVGPMIAPDANQFWKISTGDVKGYQKYLEQNGCIIDSISQLPFDFKDTVRAKVRQQLYVNDAKGLILRPDSSLSQEIAASPELHKFIKAHLSELLRGEVVSGSSSFKSSDNLHYTLNNADIIDTYINKNGDIVSFILDTYDFNPGEQWYIEWAHNVQKRGLLSGFYSLIIVVIPKNEWLKLVFHL